MSAPEDRRSPPVAGDTETVTELPDDIRVPLHSVLADLDYLFARVASDSSTAPVMVAAARKRLQQAEAAVRVALRASPAVPATPEGFAAGVEALKSRMSLMRSVVMIQGSYEMGRYDGLAEAIRVLSAPLPTSAATDRGEAEQ